MSVRRLLGHHAIRSLVFERLLLTGAAILAIAALVSGRVAAREVPRLLDVRLLSLFLVLTIAVELGKASDLFDRLVAAVAGRVRTARGLAVGMVAVSGALAALLTNDVALFLVIPFTMGFRRVGGLQLAPIVVLEVAGANVLGCVSPIGNPQNLFLYARGGFTPESFFRAQIPWCAGAAVLLAIAVPLLVPRRALVAPPVEPFDVDPLSALACVALLVGGVLALFGVLDHRLPLLLAVGGAVLLGRRLLVTDFSLVLVFAFLFVGVAGLERGRLYEVLDPVRILGHHARGMALSGALLSQIVSNVPAVMLLAPAAVGAAGFRGLLYGVNAGGCGTPVSSIANLIGAQLFVREGGRAREFWRRFLPASAALLVLLTALSLLLVS
ncbi:MAG TPA: SLC13 family permease [Thermoanaerobaculia bacterium]|nr:SLC13 family permease [Thermoanaerobaculia bacterium]